MKVFQSVRLVVLSAAAFALAQAAFAGPKTLIEMNGGAPSAGLASAWKKVSDGQYEFTLDPTKEVAKGVAVTPAAVKESLEGKLSAKGVKVADKGGNVISVSYSGDEAGFLAAVSETKVRVQATELALESSTSEGGIRANPGARPPNPGEVKATVVKVKPGFLTIVVNDSKAAQLKSGSTTKLKVSGKYKITDQVFFKPEKQEGDAWIAKAGSVTDH